MRGKNRLWQPVSRILSLEWSHPPPYTQYKSKTSQSTQSPLFTKDARSLQVEKQKKDKLLRKDSKCLHMYFKPSMMDNPFQKKKKDTSQGFPEEQSRSSVVSERTPPSSVNGAKPTRPPKTPPPNPSVLSHFLIHLLFFHYTQGRIKVTKT